jgi:hypothetical protein
VDVDQKLMLLACQHVTVSPSERLQNV